ncbi:hypothetical protein B7C42_08010 [Nocardia cerradoensis]|uniref:DUF6879 domain-containing protein n=1 Tax=Nocardia cerradoensis TaxID=85688 RepID=A0A231GTM9_9NOCA|nr:hypothetical protein [Nocardia cerradoensis]OXR39905.1 hypothetical protein B7C42_08010 [Nocardia cerradoensis]
MQLVTGEAVNGLIRACRDEALHLELRDSYDNPEDSELFRRFLAGEPDDYAWMQEWADFVGEVTGRGVAIRRARVVTVPHSDWQRWGLDVARVNVAAGEEVRYLPRHLIDPGELSTDDWWLLDNRTVVFTAFGPRGEYAGGAVSEDPVIAAHCRNVWDRVWPAAIPLSEYATR